MALARSRTLSTILLAIGAAGALVLTACSSNSNSGSAATSASSAASTAASSAAPSGTASTPASSAASGASSPASSAESVTGGEASVTGSETPVPHTGAPAPAALTQADIDAAKATLKRLEQLTVCTSLPYSPFEPDDGSGNIVGFDIDFMDWMAKDLGVQTKIIDAQFSGIQSGQAMQSGQCDIAAAGMTITPERSQSIEFSIPYYDASQTLMVLSRLRHQ